MVYNEYLNMLFSILSEGRKNDGESRETKI